MTLRWFAPRKLQLEDLECVGVKVMEPKGRVLAHLDDVSGQVLLHIGNVTLYKDGRVRVWPRSGISLQRILPALLTSAEDAVMGRRDTSTGWHQLPGTTTSVWWSDVYIPADEDHPLATALRGMGVRLADELHWDDRMRLDLGAGS